MDAYVSGQPGIVCPGLDGHHGLNVHVPIILMGPDPNPLECMEVGRHGRLA